MMFCCVVFIKYLRIGHEAHKTSSLKLEKNLNGNIFSYETLTCLIHVDFKITNKSGHSSARNTSRKFLPQTTFKSGLWIQADHLSDKATKRFSNEVLQLLLTSAFINKRGLLSKTDSSINTTTNNNNNNNNKQKAIACGFS